MARLLRGVRAPAGRFVTGPLVMSIVFGIASLIVAACLLRDTDIEAVRRWQQDRADDRSIRRQEQATAELRSSSFPRVMR